MYFIFLVSEKWVKSFKKGKNEQIDALDFRCYLPHPPFFVGVLYVVTLGESNMHWSVPFLQKICPRSVKEVLYEIVETARISYFIPVDQINCQ